jgi:Ca2+-binding RTX toxin-like protein
LNTAGVESTEVLGLNLFNAVNATIARPLGIGTIFDNDQASGTPVVRIADQVVDEASGQVAFTVALDKPSTGNVSVNVATANGSAVSGSDYQALPTQTLTFVPGEMVKVVTVGLANDTSSEPSEYFDLRLSSPVGASLPDTNARAFIAPSDATAASLPRIGVSDATADETNTWLEFVVSLSAPSTQTVRVAYNNSNVTAANGSDYLAQSSTLTFAPGETTKIVKIPVLDGLVTEPTELLGLNLFNPVNATIARPFALGTIVDNDATSGAPSLAVSDGIVDESEARAAFTVTLDKPSTSQVTVNYATADGNATSGSDYESQATQTLVFGPGEMSKTVVVDLRNDSSSEPAEFFDLTLSGAVNASIGDPRGHMVIAQSDLATVAQPVIAATSIAAPEGGSWLEFLVSLSAPSAQTVSVAYNNSNATAANGSDYLAQSSTITFAPGETVHTVRIPVLNDLTVEPTETFRLNLFNPVNALIGTSSVTGSILDNDGAPLPSQFVNVGTSNADILVGRPGANSVSGGAGNDVLDGVNGVAMSGGSGNDLYIVESTSDTVNESSGGGTDTVVSYVSTTLGANVENLILRGSALSGTGNLLANSISGNGSANTLSGGAGNDTLTGGAGSDSLAGGADADTFVFNSTSGFDTITDWSSAADTLRFSMAAIKVGDGDALVENATVRTSPGGFSTAAELVVFSSNIAGAITTASAAAAIGSATSAYAVGANVLFAVDNGTQNGVFLFHSAGADAQVSAAELTEIVQANGDATGLADYVFAP